MTDELKAAVEWLRNIPSEARPHTLESANPSHDAREEARCRRANIQRRHMLALLAHFDGEAARTAAAVAAGREEQREACARCVTGRHAAFGWDDRELKAAIQWLHETVYPQATVGERHAAVLLAHFDGEAERADAAEARVAELEAYAKLADADAKAEELRADEAVARAEKAEGEIATLRLELIVARALRDDECRVVDERTAALHKAEEERDAARAELTHERANGPTVEEWRRVTAERDEAVRALRGLLRDEWCTYEGNLEASGHATVDELEAARAVLAKYPEGA